MTTTPSNVHRLPTPSREEVVRYYERTLARVETMASILPWYTIEWREKEIAERVNDAMWLLSFRPEVRLVNEVRRELEVMDDPHAFTDTAGMAYPEDRETALAVGSGIAAMKAATMWIYRTAKAGRMGDAFFYLRSIQEEVWLPSVLDLGTPPWSDIRVDITFPMAVPK